MPYLKDCTLTSRRIDGSVYQIQVPFIREYYSNIISIDSDGDVISSFRIGSPATKYIYHTGTPISDRDYRLAIARALSLKNQTT